MKLLLDSNIVIDYLVCRKPFCESARKLMMLGYVHEFDLHLGTSQIGDIYYVMTHADARLSHVEAIDRLRRLRAFMEVCSLDSAGFDRALDSGWPDFDDACVYQVARSIRADAIITRNQKDFAMSSIKVFDCDQLFAWIEAEYDVSYDEIDF